MGSRRIHVWLNQILDDPLPVSQSSASPSLKDEGQQRKRRLPSPPSEDDTQHSSLAVLQLDDQMASKRPKVTAPASNSQHRPGPKRGREEDQEEGESGHTPRASGSAARNDSQPARPLKRASPDLASLSSSSSPSMIVDNLTLDSYGVVTRQLDVGDQRQPPALKEMLAKISKWSKHKGILSSSMRGKLGDDVSQYGFDEEDAFSKEPNDSGSSLSLTVAEELLGYAKHCRERHNSEMIWNVDVHQRLLERIFRAGDPPHLVDLLSCHAATTSKEYLSTTAAKSKLVDFCIHVAPGANPDIERNYGRHAVKLRRPIPLLCLNHTSYLGRSAQSISLSLETRRSNGDWDSAAMQIGTWQAAHWNYLEYLLVRAGGPEHAKTALDELGVLPAIIAQNHYWSFAATTREGRKTVLWLQFPFGRTSSVPGIYATAAVVEYLRQWTATVYWEWFKRNILDMFFKARRLKEVKSEKDLLSRELQKPEKLG